jgi:hypothetical protein
LRRVDAQLADGERGIVDGHRGEAPGMTEGRGKTLAELVFGEAVMLLEVLGLQKHPLRPDHLVVPGHSDSSELWLPLRGTSTNAAAVLLFLQHDAPNRPMELADGRPRTLLECAAARNRISATRAQGHEPRRRSSASLVFGCFDRPKIAMIDWLRSTDGYRSGCAGKRRNPAAAPLKGVTRSAYEA